MIKVLFFGDVFGKAGRQTLYNHLRELKVEFEPDFIIMNAENLADGRGLTEKTAHPLFKLGIDAMTGGNHLWDRSDSWDYIRNTKEIVKPMNFPPATPGNPWLTISKGDKKITVITLCGQIYMSPCDSPFSAFDAWYQDNSESAGCIILDFHAESTAEKRGMGWFADGRVSAVLGTHTHIQTADEEILPHGTAFVTDVGMTGAHDSVIGVKKEIILDKFKNGLPSRYESSDRGLQINAVYLEIDEISQKALHILRIKRPVDIPDNDATILNQD